jgi:hypothetical protein
MYTALSGKKGQIILYDVKHNTITRFDTNN